MNISRNEWKYDSDVELDLDKDLGPVLCFEAELNQVLLNLIINAVDAIQESKIKGLIEHGIIRIRTSKEEKYAVITVADNGIGIPKI